TQQNSTMVEQTNAASHSLASDAENITRLVGQFKIDGSCAPVMKLADSATAAFPLKVLVAATAASVPTHSPAKALSNKLAGAFNRNAPAASTATAAAAENWEEF